MICGIRDELKQDASACLERLGDLTKRQLAALQKGDYASLLALDKELEVVFGDKERAFGALRQHRKEHGC